jgi:histidinol-phosphate aminotransferase
MVFKAMIPACTYPGDIHSRATQRSLAYTFCNVCRYGAFPDELIKYLWRAKQPYNVSVAAETAALAALSNEDYMASVRQKIVDERERLFEKLRSIPFLEPFPSKANFILCQVHFFKTGASSVRWCIAADVPLLVFFQKH